MKLKSIFFFSIVFFFTAKNIFATHNRAGEITYQWIGANQQELKYRITITTYTKTSSYAADRMSLDSVYLGDSPTPEQFDRFSKTNIANDISINVYFKEHTYAGPGTYVIKFTDPNRNANVVNVPHSVVVPFYIESVLTINAQLGNNSSPVMTNPPIDQGCVNRIFTHNPGAFDPDPNDSLSYQLIECGGNNGEPIAGYFFPPASHSFSLDSYTGTLTWDSPLDTGEYNVAFNIIQWRDGHQIGVVRRDMQIRIGNCDDRPPVISVISDTCVLAGQLLQFDVTAIDPDRNNVNLSGKGGPLDSNLVSDPASLTPVIINNDTVVSHFSWAAQCHHVRRQPYFVLFRASDNVPPVSLVDLKGTFITVIPPGPSSVTAVPNGSSIDLSWTPAFCPGVSYYKIYRRNGIYPDSIYCPCDAGVPSYTGYQLIDSVDGNSPLLINDNNNGQGLSIGIEYCYLVTAIYPDGSESCASPQSCARLKKDGPVITRADVRFTDVVNGSVLVGWSKPNELDTIQFPGPYQYRVFHSPDFFGASFDPVPVAVYNDLNDTIYIDTINLNTKDHPWSYQIELYYTDNGNLVLKAKTAIASTVFLTITPTDNRLNLSWEQHVPWNNTRYDIFKQNSSFVYDSISSVNALQYADTGLINGATYCYFIRDIGSYSFEGFEDPLINRSQQVCSSPVDNIAPCGPSLNVFSDCGNNLNELVWNNVNNTCASDVDHYNIYFGGSENGNFELIQTISSANDTMFVHSGLSQISGCYKVTAVDTVGNETRDVVAVCVDTCRQYVLPSVFTPDADGKNDLFHPCDSTTDQELQVKNCPPYRNVKSVEMKIYNRWGNLVYETTDKNVNWDGKNKDTKADCPTGVYFYTCKVFFFSVTTEQIVNLHGTVELIRQN